MDPPANESPVESSVTPDTNDLITPEESSALPPRVRAFCRQVKEELRSAEHLERLVAARFVTCSACQSRINTMVAYGSAQPGHTLRCIVCNAKPFGMPNVVKKWSVRAANKVTHALQRIRGRRGKKQQDGAINN